MSVSPVSYEVLRSDRRTVAIQITPEGRVLVRCPRKTGEAVIRRLVCEKSDWIRAHLSEIAARPALPCLTEQELRLLTEQARTDLAARTAFWAGQIGVTWGRITVRRQHSLWGSCSSRGNLSFNCLLMLVPEEVRDYVVVHELCHRRQMNHSPAFWAEVRSVLPDYELRRKWLRENGTALIRRLPTEKSS